MQFCLEQMNKALLCEVVHHLVAVPMDDVLTKADLRLRAHHKYKFENIEQIVMLINFHSSQELLLNRILSPGHRRGSYHKLF